MIILLKEIIKFIFAKHWRTFLFFATVWTAFYLVTGLISSGYHMEDDQIVAQISKQFKELHRGYFEVLFKWQKEWLEIRFHPLFFVIPITMVKWFGNNYIALNIYRLIFIILTTFFLFSTLRFRRFTIFESLVFVTLVMVGIQTRAYFRQFCGEPQGMLCLSFAIFLVTVESQKTIWGKYKDFLAILFILFASLTKEAFILIIPPFIFYKIWISSEDDDLSLLKSIKTNLIFTIILTLIFISEMYLVFNLVGADMGYAGIKTNYFDLTKYLLLFKTYYIKTFFFVIPDIFGIVVLLNYFIKRKLPEFLKSNTLIYIIILYLLILVPQFLLHYKSNINERYLFPAVIASALLNVVIIRYLREKRIIRIGIVYIIVMITLIPSFYRCVVRAYYFVEEGRQTQQIVEKIDSSSSYSDQKTVYYIKDFLTRGLTNSLAIYIKQFHNKHNNYVLTNDYSIYLNPKFHDDAVTFEYDAFEAQIFENIRNKNEISCLVLYAEDLKNFKDDNKYWFKEEDFISNSYGRPKKDYGSYWNLIVLSRKK
jgi:hypothetical protein